MGFLDTLSSSLMSQIGISENSPQTLDYGGESFGALGSFRKDIDRSAQRSYVENGVIRNIRPRSLEVLMQEPDLTIVIKKRMFSSLVENYRLDLMDEQERLFIRASKKLFYNKCKAIAAYERLTKFEQVSSKAGFINDYSLPMISSLIDILNTPLFAQKIDQKTRSALETILKVKSLSDPNFVTTWITDKDLPYVTDTGEGTGCFELTTVSSITVKNSVNLGEGSATLTIEDPYNLMTITNDDIDIAITQASNLFEQSNFSKLTEFQLGKSINDLKEQLNTVRMDRGATPIRFMIQEETLLYKKVRAIIDEEGRDIIFKFDAGMLGANLFSPDDDSVYIDPLSTEGTNGLKEDNNEIAFFKQIIHNIYLLIGLKTTTASSSKIFNEQTNYVRKKMRLHYANKSIIQPMDVVYIFINSKTRLDSKIVQGLNFNYTDNSIVNSINNTVGNIDSEIDDIRRGFGNNKPGEESFIETEKNSIAGPEFPLWLWTLMRNDFTRQAAGTCVFVGPVSGPVSNRYGDGKYVLTVQVKDNSYYMDQCQVNVSPSLEVWNGALYDPLTPFKLKFDSGSGFVKGETPELLNENIILLNTGCIRSKMGRLKGQSLSTEKYAYIKDIDQMVYGSPNLGTRRTYFDPDGFVYRWKEGIGSLVVYGQPNSDIGSFNKDTSPNITKDPFAGQDVMNVLSLLITGQPYNFNTYMKNSINLGKLNRDDIFNSGSTDSFLRGLTNDISKKNSSWGHFIPFKRVIINEQGYNFILQNSGPALTTAGLIGSNSQLQDLLRKRSEKLDVLLKINPTAVNKYTGSPTGISGKPSGSSDPNSLQRDAVSIAVCSEINNINLEIEKAKKSFLSAQSKAGNLKYGGNGALTIYGNDITFDPSVCGDSDTANERKRRIARSEFRKKINYLTMRRLWKVKANEDINLFVVDDSYDKNYDIQAFEQSLIGLELFKSTFKSIREQVDTIKKVLDLEVFADSQGHIQARPAQYNRMPKSVYREMLQKKAERGIQLFPEYLESMFVNKIDNLGDQLGIIENQIRLYSAALGYVQDSAVQGFLSKSPDIWISGSFIFLTSEATGELYWNIKEFYQQLAPEYEEDLYKTSFNDYKNQLKQAIDSTVNFSILSQLDIMTTGVPSYDKNPDVNTRIKTMSENLQKQGIQDAPSSYAAIVSKVGTNKNALFTDQLMVVNKIAELVSERNILMRTLADSFRNFTEGLSINAKNSQVANSILLPNLYKTEDDDLDFPEMLEHMIEDENVDDLGEGSGKRYVIQDNQILSMTISETGPEYTAVQVNGKWEQGLVEMPSSAAVDFASGGNAMGSAFAVDYSLWNMYGWKTPNAIDAVFFTNPETQCAPYAIYKLNLARKSVFTAELSVVGNEFIQPGEVYYIESKDLLFYAEGVSHSYTYGGNFNTDLILKYGHNPGEYIPTSLDIIGSALYTNRNRADVVTHVRHGRSDDSIHVATLIYDYSSNDSDKSPMERLISSSLYGEQNRKNISNILLMTSDWWSTSDNSKKLKIELRRYEDTSKGLYNSATLKGIEEGVKQWILDPRKETLSQGQPTVDTSVDVNNKPNIDPNDIITEPAVDLSYLKKQSCSPSSEAWGACRAIMSSGAEGAKIANVLEEDEYLENAGYSEDTDTKMQTNKYTILSQRWTTILVNCIIDVWITFNTVESVIEIKDNNSQKDQEDASKAG